MKDKIILIVGGEPNSIFLEIFFKALKLKKIKSPLILISSENLLKKQMKKLNFKIKIKLLDYKNIEIKKLNNKAINLININYNQKNAFEKISKKSNKFIKKSFQIALKILNKGLISRFINGPISKKHFLGNKYLGITEYISKKVSSKNSCMLIYNQNLSVSPVTTHLPLKKVTKKINKKLIREQVALINDFYNKVLGFAPTIGILGLNPHCESIDKFNEDEKIIKPLVKNMREKYNVSGPFPADTIFIKKK